MAQTSLVASFLFVAFSILPLSHAAACPEGQSEMQFIAQAQVVQSLEDGSCDYKLQFSYAAPNVNCALNESELKDVTFNSPGCTVSAEKEVSGVLIRKGHRFLFD